MGLPVILDATPLGGGHGVRGIGTAVRGLVEGLAALPPGDRPALLVRAGDDVPAGFATLPVRLPGWPLGRVGLPDPWPAWRGGRALRRARPALVHATTPDLVPGGVPVVATCYDLIPLRLSGLYLTGAARRAAYRRYLAGLRRARRVIVPSHATAEDLVALVGIPASRVRVVPLGVGSPDAPVARQAAIAAPAAAPEDDGRRAPAGPGYDGADGAGGADGTGGADGGRGAGGAVAGTVGGPYVLFAGSLEPHKNPRLPVDALAGTREDVRLVMVGPWSRRRTERLRRHVASHGLAGRVTAAGYVDAATLASLTAGAAAVLVPSLVEGFGLPALEAMAAGTPVVASTAPALVEVVGDAGPALPPDRPDLWAAAIDRLVADPEARADAAARGRARAAGFTWQRTARGTVDVYREALGE